MKLSNLEMRVLALLKKKGRMRYSEIHRELEISQGGLTKLLNRLVEKGYLIRELEDDKYPPPVYYKINPEKEEELTPLFRKEAEESYMALMEFNPKEAEKLLEELKKKIEELKRR
ncbi:hypothetical protein DRP04_08430 [Archaeoglobales archaeon]|nr:MAG: hypothetical protein DRP04_08430 [Archaeoglobales archaeon]